MIRGFGHLCCGETIGIAWRRKALEWPNCDFPVGAEGATTEVERGCLEGPGVTGHGVTG